MLAIGAYVALASMTSLVGLSDRPQISRLGLALVAASVIAVPLVSMAKRRVAQALSSPALKADAAESSLCAYLSGVVLLGPGANSLFGWWWMDPAAALGVAILAFRDGWEAWRGAVEPDPDALSGLFSSKRIACLTVCCPGCPV